MNKKTSDIRDPGKEPGKKEVKKSGWQTFKPGVNPITTTVSGLLGSPELCWLIQRISSLLSHSVNMEWDGGG